MRKGRPPQKVPESMSSWVISPKRNRRNKTREQKNNVQPACVSMLGLNKYFWKVFRGERAKGMKNRRRNFKWSKIFFFCLVVYINYFANNNITEDKNCFLPSFFFFSFCVLCGREKSVNKDWINKRRFFFSYFIFLSCLLIPFFSGHTEGKRWRICKRNCLLVINALGIFTL